MLLERVDIDSHGPLKGIALGPFSHQLNVIQAPRGYGKTAWVRFLRDSLTGNTPSRRGLESSQGLAVWKAADGLYHCHREPDGTLPGRRWVTFQGRSIQPLANPGVHANVVVDVPAPIVDGIVTDTTLTSVRRVVASLLAAGLDTSVATDCASWPHSRQTEIIELQAEIARLGDQLRRRGEADDRDQAKPLRDRLAALTLELSALDARQEFASRSDAAMRQRRDDRHRLARLVEDVDRLRRRETELRQRIAKLDESLTALEAQTRRDQLLTAILEIAESRTRWLNRQIVAIRELLGQVRDLNESSFTTIRLEMLRRDVDRMIGRLEADQERWLEGDHAVQPLAGDLVSESDQALRRERRRAIGLDPESVPASLGAEDPAWVEDPVRRGQIDSLRRAERQRRLHEIADGDGSGEGTQGSLLLSLRSIGATLHAIAERLAGLRPRPLGDDPLAASGYHDGYLALPHANSPDYPGFDAPLLGRWLSADKRAEAVRCCESELLTVLSDLMNKRSALARRVAKAERLPLSLLEAITSGAAAIETLLPGDQPTSSATETSATAPLGEDSSTRERDWALRDQLSHEDVVARADARRQQESDRQRLELQRRDAAAELKATVEQMNHQLSEAERLDRRLRSEADARTEPIDPQRRSRLESKIRELQDRLASPEISPVERRYRDCWKRLRALQAGGEAPAPQASPLARSAGGYLERLSGGRLHQVLWQTAEDAVGQRRQLTIAIDGRGEDQLGEADRFLVALAVRLAAADELARRGRPLPLVVETPAIPSAPENVYADFSGPNPSVSLELVDGLMVRNLVAVLAEAAARGRQIILLTQDRAVAQSVVRFGGHGFGLDGKAHFGLPHVERANREFDIDWRQTFAIDESAEAIAGYRPHPQAADEAIARSEFDLPAAPGAVPATATASATHAVASAVESPARAESVTAPARGTAGESSEWLEQPQAVVPFPIGRRQGKSGPGGAPRNPFFLTGDSPIEAAPSIDANAAARLRAVGVVVVSQLLEASPQQLADRVRISEVTAAVIRRWQHECRLVCGVRGLRGFDARLLVGCGITHPREVANLEPAVLVEKVEAFLATDRGAAVLRTGTKQEVARLTQWIGQAKRTTPTPEDGLKYYLQRRSPVVDAPAIGPKMAERLAKVGVRTVDDLLKAQPARLASQLKVREVGEAMVQSWQHQADLVCRVPLLRGHDAQVLVTAGVTGPEQLADCQPESLLQLLQPILQSQAGRRILRGSAEPDLAEVTTWIQNAQRRRELRAAS